MDQDVGLIQKGTPLYDYLVQIGVLDPEDSADLAAEGQTTAPPSPSLWEKVKPWLQLQELASFPKHDSLRAEVGRELYPVFSRLLLRDDFTLLSHMDKDSCDHHSTSHPTLHPARVVLGVVVVFTAVAWLAAGWPGALAASSPLALLAGRLYLRAWLRPRLTTSARSLASSLHQLLSLLHRCLAFLREAELLSTGYTLHTLSLQQSSKYGRHQHSLDHPELKRRLATTLREIFFKFQSATRDLRTLVPLEEFDLDSFYLSHIPLKDFGVRLELGPDSNSEFLDFFSTSSSSDLKTLFDLVVGQVSEYLRRWCQCFLVAESTKSAVTVFERCRHQVESVLLPSVAAWLTSVQRFHQVHCSRRAAEVPAPRPLSGHSVVDSPLTTALDDLLANLHCLATHVEELRGMVGEDKLAPELQAKMAEVSRVFEYTPALVNTTAKLLPKLPHDIEEPVQPPVPPPTPSYTVPDQEDFVICDQVFVGKADPLDKSSAEFSVSDCEVLGVADQKKAFKEILGELKSAISHKAEEHRRREAQALAAAGMEPDEPDTQEPAAEETAEETPLIPKFEPPKLPTDFSSMIAAMAKQHSLQMGLKEETFSDSESSE